jgi:hypothetical protein
MNRKISKMLNHIAGKYCTPPKFICEMAKRKRKDNMIKQE